MPDNNHLVVIDDNRLLKPKGVDTLRHFVDRCRILTRIVGIRFNVFRGQPLNMHSNLVGLKKELPKINAPL